jgi:hypothetical protein
MIHPSFKQFHVYRYITFVRIQTFTYAKHCLTSIFRQIIYSRIQVKYSKYVLDVHKSATNIAILGELGLYPISLNALKSSVGYWLHTMYIVCIKILFSFEVCFNFTICSQHISPNHYYHWTVICAKNQNICFEVYQLLQTKF